jgi:glyoxylase-like metal-dependent hydrolase (beta-lactamase superfamily II)
MTSPVPVWTVGRATIGRVDEIVLEKQGSWLLPAATADLVTAHPWLDPSAYDDQGDIRLSVHSFVVDIAGTRIVVDTGVGNDKVRENPAWNNLRTDYLVRLRQAGIDPASVDVVVNTHIHRDHVGWNTVLRQGIWEPTYPNARYLTASAEWAYWSTTALTEDQQRMFADSIDPVKGAGQLELVDARTPVEIADGVTLVPTPGHTPGHVSVQITSGDETALISGDFLHHPVQVAHPRLCCGADVDPAASERTRAAVLSSIADTETLLLGSHFTHPTAGRVRTTSTGWVLAPAAAQ